MSRPEADLKAGYYPAPVDMTAAMAHRFVAASGARAGDFCAGKGEALDIFCNITGAQGWVNELENTRYRHCVERFGQQRAITGDFFTVQAERDSLGFFWANPPYSLDKVRGSGGSKRRELNFLRRMFDRGWVQTGGYFAYVVYEQHLTKDLFVMLSRKCDMVDIWSWGETIMDTYRHVIVVGRIGKGTPDTALYVRQMMAKVENREWNRLEDAPETAYIIPAPLNNDQFKFHQLEITKAQTVAAQQAYGADQTAAYKLWSHINNEREILRPVMKVKLGHLVTLIQAGLLDKALIETDRGLCAIRSVMRYVETKVELPDSDDDDKKGKKLVKAIRQMKSNIYLTYETGEVVSLDTDAKIRDFLLSYSDQLFAFVDRTLRPCFDLLGGAGYAPYDVWRGYINACRVRGKHDYFPAQAAGVNAALHMLYGEDKRGIYLVFEPSVGKTSISAGMIASTVQATVDGNLKDSHVRPGDVFQIICPANMIRKWKRELSEMIPHANILTLSLKDENDHSHDLTREFAEFMRLHENDPIGVVNIIIMNQDSIKHGEGLTPARFKGTKGRWFCPTTGTQLLEDEEKDKKKVKRPFLVNEMPDGHEWIEDKSVDPDFLNDDDPYDGKIMAKKFIAPPKNHFALFQESRRYRKPKVGNGRVLTETVDKELLLPARRLITTYNKLNYSVRHQYIETNRPLGVKNGFRFYARIKRSIAVSKRLSDPLRHKTHKRFLQVIGKRYVCEGLRAYVVHGSLIVSRPCHIVKTQEIIENLTKEDIADPWIAARGTMYALNPRMPLWRIAQRFENRVAVLFIDECHNSASVGTDIWSSTAHIAMMARKIVGLTGTLSRGLASSIYGLEAIINPTRLFKRYPWGEVGLGQWIKDMGSLSVIYEEDANEEDDFGVNTGVRRKSKGKTEETAGATALLVAWILDHGLFMDLMDLGKILTPYNQYAVAVKMNENQHADYRRVENQLIGNKDYIGGGLAYNYLTQYINSPRQPLDLYGWKITRDENGWIIDRERILCATTLTYDTDELLGKEIELIKIIKTRLAEGRGVGVFLKYGTAQKRFYADKLRELIEQHVPEAKIAVLTADVEPVKREAWIEKKVEQGCNVLITNPDLVREGLDLLDFPVLVWYEHIEKLITVVQASARGRRIPQIHACEVIMLYYEKSIEQNQIETMAKKLRAHAILNGREVTLNDSTDNGGDFISEVIAKMAGGSGVAVDLAAIFAEINAIHAQMTREGTEIVEVVGKALVNHPCEVYDYVQAHMDRKQQKDRILSTRQVAIEDAGQVSMF